MSREAMPAPDRENSMQNPFWHRSTSGSQFTGGASSVRFRETKPGQHAGLSTDIIKNDRNLRLFHRMLVPQSGIDRIGVWNLPARGWCVF